MGSALGAMVMRMLIDHRQEVGMRSVTSIGLVGFLKVLDKKIRKDNDWDTSFHVFLVLSNENEIPLSPSSSRSH